jgi:hypothetical protein
LVVVEVVHQATSVVMGVQAVAEVLLQRAEQGLQDRDTVVAVELLRGKTEKAVAVALVRLVLVELLVLVVMVALVFLPTLLVLL